MKQLKTKFSGVGEVSGYEFSQIKQTDKGFIYEVSSDDSKHYEVFKKKVNKRFGNISYPTSKAFGIWAWTCNSLEKAEKRLETFK